jgi:dephospho-CoA kinase
MLVVYPESFVDMDSFVPVTERSQEVLKIEEEYFGEFVVEDHSLVAEGVVDYSVDS